MLLPKKIFFIFAVLHRNGLSIELHEISMFHNALQYETEGDGFPFSSHVVARPSERNFHVSFKSIKTYKINVRVPLTVHGENQL
jgi:hypothetical protein